MAQRMATFTAVASDSCGVVRVEDMLAAVRPATVLLTLMHSNNEVGSLQPISQVADAIAGRKLVFHTDAAQVRGAWYMIEGGLGWTRIGPVYLCCLLYRFEDGG